MGSQKRKSESREVLEDILGEKKLSKLLDGEPLRVTHLGRELELNRKGYLKDSKTGRSIHASLNRSRKRCNRILTVYLVLDESDDSEKVYSTLRIDPKILPSESLKEKISEQIELLNKRERLLERKKELEEKLKSDGNNDGPPDMSLPRNDTEIELSRVKAELIRIW